MNKCPFCEIEDEKIILKNDLCYAIYDRFPVNPGHILIIPFRHFSSFFESSDEERVAIFNLLDKCKEFLDKKYQPDGYNIGINVGHFAGQTIFHLHVHLIPRYKGDIDNPRGGVRGVIPAKRMYRSE